jgi:hypothetical protein
MNERIKELARQAGFNDFPNDENGVWITDGYWSEQLERFAELVRQDYANQFITDAERDENIRSEERRHVAEHYLAIMRDAVEQAVKREREACAKLCDDASLYFIDQGMNAAYGADYCANEIRGRTEPKSDFKTQMDDNWAGLI